MHTYKFVVKGKEYSVPYLRFRSIPFLYTLQKRMMGYRYFKKFSINESESSKRMNKIMKTIMREAERDMLLGANIDYGNFSISIERRLTSKRTQTVKNGYLYIPVIRLKKFPKMNGIKFEIYPKLRYQCEISRMIETNVYDNLK